MFLSKGHRDLRFAFQTHTGSQASSRRKAKDSTLLLSRVGYVLTYDGEFRLPLVLAQGSPFFHSSCQGELGVALESLQDKGDLI